MSKTTAVFDRHGVRGACVSTLLFLSSLMKSGNSTDVARAPAVHSTDIQEVSGDAARAGNDNVHATLLNTVGCLNRELWQNQLLIRDQAGVAEALGKASADCVVQTRSDAA